MSKQYYFRTYDQARAKYLRLQKQGKKVVLRRPNLQRKSYLVKVL